MTTSRTRSRGGSEKPIQLNLATSKDVAILRSKEWFNFDEPEIDLMNKSLLFKLETILRFKNKKVYSDIETVGEVLLELPTKEVIQIASINYSSGTAYGNPVLDYLERKWIRRRSASAL